MIPMHMKSNQDLAHELENATFIIKTWLINDDIKASEVELSAMEDFINDVSPTISKRLLKGV